MACIHKIDLVDSRSIALYLAEENYNSAPFQGRNFLHTGKFEGKYYLDETDIMSSYLRLITVHCQKRDIQ